MAKKNEAKVELEQKALVAIENVEALDMLFEAEKFNQMQRAANMFASSDLVPEHFRGKPANVMVALQLSHALQINPLLLMMKIYPVHGKFGFEGQLMIALANTRGPFCEPIQYELKGDGMERTCTAFAHIAGISLPCKAVCSMKIAKDEGWYDRKDKSGNFCSKWRTMPDLMLQYRAATFLIRLHCPEVLMGMPTADELHDIEPAIEVSATVNDIQDRMAKARETAPKPPKTEPDPKVANVMPQDLFTVIRAKDRKLANHVWGQAIAAGWNASDFLARHESFVDVGQKSAEEALAIMRGKFEEPELYVDISDTVPNEVFLATQGMDLDLVGNAWALAAAAGWAAKKFINEFNMAGSDNEALENIVVELKTAKE